MKFGNENKKITVIYGGWSDEREISLKTGKAILGSLISQGFDARGLDLSINNLDQIDGDIVYIALHGKGGEDGFIQAYLDMQNIPYTGSGALASSICMNKYYTKKILQASNIPTPNYAKKKVLDLVFDGKPVVLKAMAQGSAIGVHIVKTQNDFAKAVADLKKYEEIMVEEYIQGREFTVGIVGDLVLPVIEIISKNDFYDFDAKYSVGKSEHIFPKDVDFLKDLAVKTHTVLGCHAVSRVDLMINEKGEPFVIEINTIPGMTETSLLPDAAAKIGISFNELVVKILEASF